MQLDGQLEAALKSSDPLARLRSLVQHFQDQGQDPQTILLFFEQARQSLRVAGRQREEDIVLEVMDFLVGWCSPHMSLRPKDRRQAGREAK
jgi:hypothetical protein